MSGDNMNDKITLYADSSEDSRALEQSFMDQGYSVSMIVSCTNEPTAIYEGRFVTGLTDIDALFDVRLK
jgi:hypothetical protein